MFTSPCSLVCEKITGKLASAGFSFDPDYEEHDDVLEALANSVVFPRDFHVPDSAGYSDALPEDFQILMEEKIAIFVNKRLLTAMNRLGLGVQSVFSEEERAALGRDLFRLMAARMRPDFFDDFDLAEIRDIKFLFRGKKTKAELNAPNLNAAIAQFALDLQARGEWTQRCSDNPFIVNVLQKDRFVESLKVSLTTTWKDDRDGSWLYVAVVSGWAKTPYFIEYNPTGHPKYAVFVHSDPYYGRDRLLGSFRTMKDARLNALEHLKKRLATQNGGSSIRTQV
jgi:hypothetical protein